jgi:hypothetical protein
MLTDAPWATEPDFRTCGLMEEKSEEYSTGLRRELSLAWIALRILSATPFPLPILPTRLNFG